MKFERIVELREDNRLTQKQVAEVLKIRQQSYARYEIGDIDFPIRHLITLSKLYKVSIDYMVGRTNKKDINK